MPGSTTHAFATPIYFDASAGTASLNEALGNLIRDMAAEVPSDDAFRAHRGGWYSDGKFFQRRESEVKDVFRLVMAGIDQYVRDLEVAATIEAVELQAWVALTRSGDYQTPHLHAGASLSGVYYVACPSRPEPEGAIDFITPIDVQEATFLKGWSRSFCRVLPRSGSLVIFPAYLRHFTHPFEGREERICVVFNAFIRQQRR